MSETTVNILVSKILSVTNETATITTAIKGMVSELHKALAGQEDTSFEPVYTGDLPEVVQAVYAKCEQLNYDTKKRNSYMNTINKAMQRAVKEIVSACEEKGQHCYFCDSNDNVRQLAVTTGTKTERKIGVKFKNAREEQTLEKYVENVLKYIDSKDITVDEFRKEFNKQSKQSAKTTKKVKLEKVA